MIQLFISDIDGCLAEPYRPFHRDRLETLARYAAEAGPIGASDVRPALSLCSGRPYPYVEAMTQLLGVQVPVLFESGAGLFDPVAARVHWNPAFTAEMEEQLADVEQWLVDARGTDSPLMVEHSKRAQVGLVGPSVEAVEAILPRIEAYVREQGLALHVFHTTVSIDIVPTTLTKRQALDWLADVTDLSLHEMAYIGDTNGDIEALKAVGSSFAPANAVPDVKQAVRVVTQASLTDGVIEAYDRCVAYNHAIRARAS